MSGLLDCAQEAQPAVSPLGNPSSLQLQDASTTVLDVLRCDCGRPRSYRHPRCLPRDLRRRSWRARFQEDFAPVLEAWAADMEPEQEERDAAAILFAGFFSFDVHEVTLLVRRDRDYKLVRRIARRYLEQKIWTYDGLSLGEDFEEYANIGITLLAMVGTGKLACAKPGSAYKLAHT